MCIRDRIKKLSYPLDHNFKKTKSTIILIGKTFGHIEQSCFLKENFSTSEGLPPEINLNNEKNNGETVLKLIRKNLVLSVHDVSSGGLLVSLSEMSIGSNLGAKIYKPKKLNNKFEYFFGEDQGRYIIEIKPKNLENVENMLKKDSIHFDKLGLVEGNEIMLENDLKISIEDIKEGYKKWLKEYMVN